MSAPIDINQYSYDLPADRIALHPLPQRDQSKLLVCRGGDIGHHHFFQLPDLLDVKSMLVLNDTRVIPARILFQKTTGAMIEVFLLQPVAPSPLVQAAMTARGSVAWKCVIGNLKRWSSGPLDLSVGDISLQATLEDRDNGVVSFRWNSDATFAELVELVGKIPLPPYLKRDAEADDTTRYQTVYASHRGAVAAPTAGLHLTPGVFRNLDERGIAHTTVTLHVGAGTFMPVKTDNALDHVMHEEQVVITSKLVEDLMSGKFVVAVGTTSMRVIESIYWFGCKLVEDPLASFVVSQYDPYGPLREVPLEHSLQAVRERIGQQGSIDGRTSIYIYPGYRFRVTNGLITNFHQPASTLMLLVAAFIGDDWKRVYSEAMSNGYRFLSYGDSSLLLPR